MIGWRVWAGGWGEWLTEWLTKTSFVLQQQQQHLQSTERHHHHRHFGSDVNKDFSANQRQGLHLQGQGLDHQGQEPDF